MTKDEYEAIKEYIDAAIEKAIAEYECLVTSTHPGMGQAERKRAAERALEAITAEKASD